jgi:hypothetical protein
MIFVGLSSGATGVAIDTGFTITDGNDGGTFGVNFGGTMAYLIDAAATSINPTWTWTGGASFNTLIVSYYGAVGASGIGVLAFGPHAINGDALFLTPTGPANLAFGPLGMGSSAALDEGLPLGRLRQFWTL